MLGSSMCVLVVLFICLTALSYKNNKLLRQSIINGDVFCFFLMTFVTFMTLLSIRFPAMAYLTSAKSVSEFLHQVTL